MVHRQADAVNIGFCRREEEAPGGNVHGHDEGGGEILRRPEAVHVDGVDAGHVGVFQEPRGLAQLPQGAAQSGGAAGGVPVGTAVGQDQDVVLPPQQGGGLLGGKSVHFSSSRTMCSLAGLAGLTTLGSRSISRMWAPCWMESSAMNWSSGV